MKLKIPTTKLKP